MRQFINIVENAQDGVPRMLYHGTSLINLVAIVAEDAVLLHADDENTCGFFMSPKEALAAEYRECLSGGPMGGVITLDAEAMIAAGWQILPNRYHGGDEPEFVLTTGEEGFLNGIHPFIREIIVPRASIETLKDSLHGKVSELAMRYEDPKEWRAALKKFLKFSRVRVA